MKRLFFSQMKKTIKEYLYENHKTTWDRHTTQRINECHPMIRNFLFAVISYLEKEKGIKLRVTDWIRSFQEQDDLYAKGRTVPGRIITNARAGESWHNYALAVDTVEIRDGKVMYENERWIEIAQPFEDLGFIWGGRWLSAKQKTLPINEQKRLISSGEGFDKPHFHKNFSLTINRARELYEQKKTKFITI